MSEQAIANVQASVVVYDDGLKKWIPAGVPSDPQGLSNVQIFHHLQMNTFRVVGRKISDHEVVLNCAVSKTLNYNRTTKTFHQWRGNRRQIYGLNFVSSDDASSFADAMLNALDILSAGNGGLQRRNDASQENIVNGVAHQPIYGTAGVLTASHQNGSVGTDLYRNGAAGDHSVISTRPYSTPAVSSASLTAVTSSSMDVANDVTASSLRHSTMPPSSTAYDGATTAANVGDQPKNLTVGGGPVVNCQQNAGGGRTGNLGYYTNGTGHQRRSSQSSNHSSGSISSSNVIYSSSASTTTISEHYAFPYNQNPSNFHTSGPPPAPPCPNWSNQRPTPALNNVSRSNLVNNSDSCAASRHVPTAPPPPPGSFYIQSNDSASQPNAFAQALASAKLKKTSCSKLSNGTAADSASLKDARSNSSGSVESQLRVSSSSQQHTSMISEMAAMLAKRRLMLQESESLANNSYESPDDLAHPHHDSRKVDAQQKFETEKPAETPRTHRKIPSGSSLSSQEEGLLSVGLSLAPTFHGSNIVSHRSTCGSSASLVNLGTSNLNSVGSLATPLATQNSSVSGPPPAPPLRSVSNGVAGGGVLFSASSSVSLNSNGGAGHLLCPTANSSSSNCKEALNWNEILQDFKAELMKEFRTELTKAKMEIMELIRSEFKR